MSKSFNEEILLPQHEVLDRIVYALVIDRLFQTVASRRSGKIAREIHIHLELAPQILFVRKHAVIGIEDCIVKANDV